MEKIVLKCMCHQIGHTPHAKNTCTLFKREKKREGQGEKDRGRRR